MEISVGLPNAAHAQGLIQRLAGALEATVSFDAGLKEIRVLPDMQTDQAVIRIVDVVDHWLERGDVDSAKLSLGNRSYTLFASGRIAGYR